MRKRIVIITVIIVVIGIVIFLLARNTNVFGRGRAEKEVTDMAKVWLMESEGPIEKTTYTVTEGNEIYIYNVDNKLVAYINGDIPYDPARSKEDAENLRSPEEVWSSFCERFATEIEALEEYYFVWAEEGDAGWDLNLHRDIGSHVYDQILINATWEGEIENTVITLSRLTEDLPEEIIQKVEAEIDSYIHRAQPTSDDCDISIRYDRLEDERILATCTLIYNFPDDTKYGEVKMIIIERKKMNRLRGRSNKTSKLFWEAV